MALRYQLYHIIGNALFYGIHYANFVRGSCSSKQAEALLPDILLLGQYKFDYQSLLLIHKSGNIRLTEKESLLHRYFYLNKNRLIKREEVLLQIWKSDDYFSGRSLDVFVSKLRKYLLEDDRIVIETVRGVGFEFKFNEL